MLQKFSDGFLFVWNRADDERWLELQKFVYWFQVLAIAELRQSGYRGDFRALFRHFDQRFLRSQSA